MTRMERLQAAARKADSQWRRALAIYRTIRAEVRPEEWHYSRITDPDPEDQAALNRLERAENALAAARTCMDEAERSALFGGAEACCPAHSW